MLLLVIGEPVSGIEGSTQLALDFIAAHLREVGETLARIRGAGDVLTVSSLALLLLLVRLLVLLLSPAATLADALPAVAARSITLTLSLTLALM